VEVHSIFGAALDKLTSQLHCFSQNTILNRGPELKKHIFNISGMFEI